MWRVLALENERFKSQWLNVGGMETLNSYQFCGDIDVIPPSHREFIRGFRDYHETDTHVFTHANYDPDLPFADQPPHALRWQLLEPPFPPPHVSGKKIVVGHSEQRDGEVLDLGHLLRLDTGCRSYSSARVAHDRHLHDDISQQRIQRVHFVSCPDSNPADGPSVSPGRTTKESDPPGIQPDDRALTL